MNKINDNTNRWKSILYFWIGRINIVKMTILHKAIYRFNEISIKIPMAFFIELQQKDTDWLNGYKNKTHIYAVYKRPTSDLGAQTD